MYKPNTMIKFTYFGVENKAYMLDTTSKEIYTHGFHESSDFKSFRFAAFGASPLIVVSLFSGLYSGTDSTFKLILAIFGIFIGVLTSYLFRTRVLSSPQREEYFKKYPYARRIDNVDEIKKILDGEYKVMRRTQVLCAISAFISVILFIIYLNTSEWLMYFLALGVFVCASIIAALAIRCSDILELFSIY